MSTPVRQQYLRLKALHPDALLFFRLGDFYELFDADAETAARELQLTLTGREFARGHRTPMAGVPYHHADSYIVRLIERGFRVAIAEQIGDPRTAKGLVERRIVRLVTPGTIQEPQLLDAGRNNYLTAILPQEGAAGIAYADITTGEFVLQQVTGEPITPALLQELLRIAPAECLWPLDGVQESLEPAADEQGAALSTPAPGSETPEPALPAPTVEEPLRVPGCAMTPFSREHFALDAARAALSTHLGLQTIADEPYAPFTLAVSAAGALLAYLRHTQHAALPLLRHPLLYRAQDHMTLDASTRRNLELLQTMRGGAPAGSLLAVLDRTRTPMGSRLLRRWLNAPLIVLPPLLRRQEAVATLATSTTLRLRVLDALSGIGDIDRLVSRAQQGSATPRELLALARTLERLRSLQGALKAGGVSERATGGTRLRIGQRPDQPSDMTGGGSSCPTRTRPSDEGAAGGTRVRVGQHPDRGVPARESGPSDALEPSGATLFALHAALDSCDEVGSSIRSAFVDDPPAVLTDGGFVRPGYDAAIDAIDEGSREAREWLAALEANERARTGIRALKVVYNRISGYALEVGKAAVGQVPPDYVRKQTVATGERYVTPELKQREAQLLHAQERRSALEYAVLERVRAAVATQAERMLRSSDAVAQLDVYAAFAMVALEQQYVCPRLDEGDTIAIEDGRHPVVEVTQREVAFVPNDTLLDADCRLVVLTGPNMAGKSTYLRQVAHIVLLAQVGSFVPARSAHIGLVDRIFTRVGAQDDLASGQSTFMVEMAETSAILAACTPRSLLILDEIGRGTSTYDGLAIAQAVLEHLHDDPGHRAKTIFATHYHELTALADRRPHVRNFRMEVLEEGDRVLFLRRVAPGGADKSYGIHVAELAGLPPRVIRRARTLLRDYEQSGHTGRVTRRQVPDTPSDRQLSLFEQPAQAD